MPAPEVLETMHRAIRLGLLLSLGACGDTVVSDGEGGVQQLGGSGGAGAAPGAGGGDPFGDAGGTAPLGGSGGSGGERAAECAVASDCGVATDCLVFSCDEGACSVSDNEGQSLADPVGNCTALKCVGGLAVPQIDESDAPPATGCGFFWCEGFDLEHVDTPIGQQCVTGQCDGSGYCVACLADPACSVWPCPAWEWNQVAGNCQQEMCADPDTPTSAPDDADVPSAPDCTTLYSCENGVLSSEPAVEGAPCQEGDGECTATGECACVTDCECNVSADCPVPMTYCAAAECNLGLCDQVPMMGGQSPYQVPGDCQFVVCSPGPMPLDVLDPPPSTECAVGSCGLNGVFWAPVAGGTPCATGFCDGATTFGQCVSCYEGQGSCPKGFHCPPTGASACASDP